MSPQQWDNPPEMQIDTEAQYFATLKTSKGDIELQLFPEHAPKTVTTSCFSPNSPSMTVFSFTGLSTTLWYRPAIPPEPDGADPGIASKTRRKAIP